MSIFKTAMTSAAVLAGGLAVAPQQAEAGGQLGNFGLYAPSGFGFGNGYRGTNLYGNSGYGGGYGRYYGNGGYGGGYGGYGAGYGGGFGGTAVYHDTSHFDYVPGVAVPHGNHTHYVPGHAQYHQTGHYDVYGPGHFGGY